MGNNNKVLLSCVIVLLFAVIGLSTYLIINSTPKDDDCKELDTKTQETSKEKDKEKEKIVLSNIKDVYKEAFYYINNGENLEYDEKTLSKYFTKKGLSEVEKLYTDTTGSLLLTSIFNTTDQGLRKLTLRMYDDETAVATGLYTPTKISDEDSNESYSVGEKSKYPEYIIFKKDSGVWKIEMFE